MNKISINNIKLEMINYFKNDLKRINHALKVYSFSKIISETEKISELENICLEISAILHDIGIKESEKKYNSTSGKYQEIEGPVVALSILKKMDFMSQEIIDRVLFIIGHHHTYTKIDKIDFQILVEADFIVNIDEDKMETKTIESIKNKYFKTDTGKFLIDKMYL